MDARQYQGVTRNEHSAERAEYSEAQRTIVFATGEESPSNTLRPESRPTFKFLVAVRRPRSADIGIPQNPVLDSCQNEGPFSDSK